MSEVRSDGPLPPDEAPTSSAEATTTRKPKLCPTGLPVRDLCRLGEDEAEEE